MVVALMEIRLLTAFSDAEFARLVVGYTSSERYRVERRQSAGEVCLCLHLETLPQPYTKRFESDPEEMARYRACLDEGFSYGAYLDGRLDGLLLAAPHWWNRTLWVWEFHIAPERQRQGLGRALLSAAAAKARSAGLRALVCETQNTNLPGIRAYQRLGFTLDAIDLSYYTNYDALDGEVAVFMKYHLEEDHADRT